MSQTVEWFRSLFAAPSAEVLALDELEEAKPVKKVAKKK